jgi:hypothetical protein
LQACLIKLASALRITMQTDKNYQTQQDQKKRRTE